MASKIHRVSKDFELVTKYKPTGDQPTAIKELVEGIYDGRKFQVLLGATGTGKTFTMANVIQQVQRPTLILVHNKTLAGQLYAEMKDLFPNNRVEYFISNFDFYTPEAYLPSSDTYIDKMAFVNDELEMMRVSAINSILERTDTIVVASVASIYGLTDPEEYQKLIFEVRENEDIDRHDLFKRLIDSQFERSMYDITPGTFRVHGDIIDIMPVSEQDYYIRLDTFGDTIEKIAKVEVVTGKVVETYHKYSLFPAYDHASSHQIMKEAVVTIKEELKERLEYFRKEGKLLEAERLEQRTLQDCDNLLEHGMCPGVENYSRHIDKRKPGQKPFCLLDYFPDNYLMFVDESHVSLPQIRGMYAGDRSRKETLVEFGFRLPSALDNRPLCFEEFEEHINQIICTSATPGDYELEKANNRVVEQIIRPTGLLDPIIEVRPTEGQIFDLIGEIKQRIERHERTMILTLTIKMAEDLTLFLKEKGIKTVYMHNECKTLERSQIIYDLRTGKYDVIVGINLLREGLDIPEISLVAILDADKQGFLRSHRSLIQIVGRAARNKDGIAIMYADEITESMRTCIEETNRRRQIQMEYNEENGIIPTTIIKEIKNPLHNTEKGDDVEIKGKLTKTEARNKIREIERLMKDAAKNFDFERAIELRNIMFELKDEYGIY